MVVARGDWAYARKDWYLVSRPDGGHWISQEKRESVERQAYSFGIYQDAWK